MKISIKREQNQASLSFAERKKFRPKVKRKQLLLLLALLITAATGAWAQDTKHRITATLNFSSQTKQKTLDVTLPYETTIGAVYTAIIGQAPPSSLSPTAAEVTSGTNVTIGELNRWDTPVNVTADGNATVGFTATLGNGTITLSVAPVYAVNLADGTQDAKNWTIASGDNSATGDVADGLTGLSKGNAVTLTYGGRLKVKAVTATTDAANPNAYLKWDAAKKKLVEAEIPETVTKVTNADDYVTWAAGTYLVEGNVTINGEVTLSGDVELIIKDGAKLTAKFIFGDTHNLNIYGLANKSGELNVACSGSDAIVNLSVLNIHSCKVNASSSKSNCGGFYYIGEFNVYGGSVDAKYTGDEQGYGLCDISSLNIWHGEMKAEGKGTSNYSYGIAWDVNDTNVTVYGGKLWVKADTNALNPSDEVTFTKADSYDGKIETSDDGENWTVYNGSGKPNTKYVRVGY